MNLKNVYEQVQERIQGIEFEQLWPGFKMFEFALYDQDIVILNGEFVEKTDEFVANTAIYYQGRYIAIWNLTEEWDIDILTSKIIHEMFHAYQNQQKESRFPNEFVALCNYQYSENYLQLKYNENLLLAELVDEFSEDIFNKFLSYRKMRGVEYPYEYQYENGVESIEGVAQYVELQTLNILCKEKYIELLRRLKDGLKEEKKLIPIRISCYEVGALFLLVCKENNLPINQEIGNTSKVFYDQLVEQVPYQKIVVTVEPGIFQLYRDDIKQLEERIQRIQEQNQWVIKGRFDLCGLNIYSARYHKGYLYSEKFLMFQDEQIRTLYGNYLVKLENKKIVEIYKELE